MKVFANALIYDMKGKPLKYPPNDPRAGEDMTFATAAIDALVTVLPDEQQRPTDGKQKYDRYKIALKIEEGCANGGSVELSVDELKEIKTAVGRCYSPVVVGRVYDLIETAEIAQKESQPKPH